MNRFFSFALFALGFAYGAAAGDLDFTKGVFFVNEDWYGHQNSTVNYLLPDDPERAYWHYRIDQEINPGRELGCTAQYGAIWDGRFYIMAKQAKDPGAEITGGRISVLDASTMEMIRQLEIIDPSGRQCDGRGFVGVSATKAYVSSSNGIWILNLETLDIEGQVEGSANPNVGDDKPNSDPTSSLYFGQTGMMILAGNRVFAVHQQYGLLVVDTETDRVEKVLDMAIVDDAIEADTGVRPSKPSGIGSTIVRAKDGSLWHAAAKNVQGTGATVPYLVRVDPVTLEREVVRIEGTGIYPPSNSWYAWTPDPFCASSVTNRLYWCGGPGRWSSSGIIFRFDVDTRRVEPIVDFSALPDSWLVYGCSLGIHPETDELYASLYHKFVDDTYITRRMDADGNIIRDYAMIANYWFPSLPVFPAGAGHSGVESVAVESGSKHGPVRGVYTLQGIRLGDTLEGLPPGIYIADGRKIRIR